MLFNLLAEAGEQNPVTTYIIFGVLIVAIIGLFVWQSISGKKKQKEAQEKVNALKKGDRVKTIGGVCGFVFEINDAENTFVLETGTGDNKSYVKFDKAAIYQTAPAEGYANAPANAPAPEAPQEVKEEAPAEPFEETTKEVAEEKVEETVAEEKTEEVSEKPAKKSTKKK